MLRCEKYKMSDFNWQVEENDIVPLKCINLLVKTNCYKLLTERMFGELKFDLIYNKLKKL